MLSLYFDLFYVMLVETFFEKASSLRGTMVVLYTEVHVYCIYCKTLGVGGKGGGTPPCVIMLHF